MAGEFYSSRVLLADTLDYRCLHKTPRSPREGEHTVGAVPVELVRGLHFSTKFLNRFRDFERIFLRKEAACSGELKFPAAPR